MARQHQCAACGKTAPWGEGWSQYGSINDEDAGRTIITCPDEKCRKEAKQIYARQPALIYRPFGYG